MARCLVGTFCFAGKSWLVPSLMLALSGWLLAVPGPAMAQSQQCQAWRAELASLGNGGGGDAGAGREAQRVGAELSRTSNQFRAMGCERQQFLFFGEAPPPQCGVIRQRLGELQGAYASLQQRAQGRAPANGPRRAQLQAAIEANCRAGFYQTPEPVQQPARQRGFFEALFGLPEERPQRPLGMPELDQPLEPEKPRTATWGSGRAVCVRSCDGFFFPLSTSPGGREGADEMCQALCPAAETNVYYMGGSGDIESAVGRGGSAYTSLANASRYTRSFDATCTCRRPGESWSKTLSEAEEMIERRKGDVIVSAQRAEELSKPRETRRTERERKRTPESRATDAANAVNEPSATASSTPTSGTESAGIGPKTVDTGTVGVDQGQTRKLTTADGETRTVRIVAPAVTPQAGSNRPVGQLPTAVR
jgi:hypothetical protein